jgi:hypothetical protein
VERIGEPAGIHHVIADLDIDRAAEFNIQINGARGSFCSQTASIHRMKFVAWFQVC